MDVINGCSLQLQHLAALCEAANLLHQPVGDALQDGDHALEISDLNHDSNHFESWLTLSLPEVNIGEKVALICFQASPVRLNIWVEIQQTFYIFGYCLTMR